MVTDRSMSSIATITGFGNVTMMHLFYIFLGNRSLVWSICWSYMNGYRHINVVNCYYYWIWQRYYDASILYLQRKDVSCLEHLQDLQE